MKNKAFFLGKKFLKQELINGSMYIFIGSIIANIFNFFFNLLMSRNLAVENYGVLTSIVSLITLTTIPVGSVIPTVVNFAGSPFANGDYALVRAFFFKIIKPLFVISFIFVFGFIIFAIKIGDFFHIADQSLIIIAGMIVFISYIGIINNGLLQAKLAFKFISFSNFISTFIKFLIGVILVFLGFNLKGVMWALFLSAVFPFIISFIPLRFIFKKQKPLSNIIHFKNLISYGIPSSLTTLGLASLISTDILLVKHFYNPSDAGIYAGLSLVGRAIFFFTAPIGSVMFPLIVQKYAKRESYNNIFKMALVLVFAPSAFLSIIYFLYPDFIIKFFIKNEAYLSVSHLLGLFGIFTTAYSLISLFIYYFLSVKKTNVYIPVVFFALVQVLLIILYHHSLFQVVIISLAVSILLLSTLLFYYIKVYGEYKKIKRPVVIVGRPNEIDISVWQ